MYISYDNLWKTLIDRKMTKTELMRETGMSSRTLAKLSKNQNVTTETLLQICEALGCGIGGVMEIREGEQVLSFAETFKRSAVLISEDVFCKNYRLAYGGITYVIRKTKRTANKKTVIHCRGADVVWEQAYPAGFARAHEEDVLGRVDYFSKNERGIYLVTGAPKCIVGLDENGFVSSRGTLRSQSDVYVMSQAAFQKFVPEKSSDGE